MRSRAREIALQVLFQTEFRTTDTELSVKEAKEQNTKPASILPSTLPTDTSPETNFHLYDERDRESLDYAKYLVEGVRRKQDTLDELLEKFSHHWKLSRMALVDRNILRVATFELLYGEDLTVATVINEAVELAKKFGQKDSSGFINGILDQIAKQRDSA